MATADDARPQRAPRYDGEDTSPTTERELLGWYSYGLAAEVFAVAGVGSFLPVTLEQLARERGVLWSDKTTSCIAKEVSDSGSVSAARLLIRAVGGRAADQCAIYILGSKVSTASFAMYTFSVAVLVQALTLVSFSSIADHADYRKRLLIGFAFTGASASMLFLIVVPRIYFLGSLLVIVGVTCLGSSFVLLNSFLPLLASNHPSVPGGFQALKQEDSHIPMEDLQPDQEHLGSGLHDLHADIEPDLNKNFQSSSIELGLSTKISSKGVGFGYTAAVFVQILSILVLFGMKHISLDPTSQTLPLRLVLFMVGFWWLAFTTPALLYLKPRPGPPLITSSSRGGIGRLLTYWEQVCSAWGGLWKTVKVASKLRQLVIFLVAWFILSDAISSVSSTAILFARTELHLGTIAIACLSITVMVSGITGAFAWPVISRRFALKENHTIVCCIALMEVIPVYGLMGYLPFIRAWGVGGLQQAWEIYPLGIVHGFVMGGLSSYCRSFYGLLFPPGSEAAFYALYAVTDKGSSAVGPTIVGAIVDATGTIRPAFAFLAVLIALPVPLIWVIDVQRGREDALRMVEVTKSGSRARGDLRDVNNETEEAEAFLHHDE